MPLSESASRLSIGVWAVLWLPGLFLASWRMERLLRASRVTRALVEVLALLVAPLLAFGLYALSDAQRYAQAHNAQVAGNTLISIAYVAMPYAVSAGFLLLVLRRQASPPAESRWWIAALIGLFAVLVWAPGLFMAQLVALVGS